jgi:hypothetical protein
MFEFSGCPSGPSEEGLGLITTPSLQPALFFRIPADVDINESGICPVLTCPSLRHSVLQVCNNSPYFARSGAMRHESRPDRTIMDHVKDQADLIQLWQASR